VVISNQQYHVVIFLWLLSDWSHVIDFSRWYSLCSICTHLSLSVSLSLFLSCRGQC